MSERFLAYLALARAERVTADAVAAQMRAMFPQVPMDIGSDQMPGEAARVSGGFILDVAGSKLAILFVPQPLPPDSYAVPLELDRFWPQARPAMAAQQAHVVVGQVSETTDHGAALAMAGAMTFAVAALSALLPALAVVWANGETVTEPGQFREAATRLAARQMPVLIWVGMRWLDGPRTATGARSFAVLTSGMRQFIGREVEWLPTALPPATIADRIIGTCQYLIVNGSIIKDGDTLGVTLLERIRVVYSDSGWRPKISVLKLSLEQIDAKETQNATRNSA